MSFGYGVGDFIAVGTLALRLYVSYRDGPSEYRELTRELLSLHTTLEQLRADMEDSDSILARCTPKKLAKLEDIVGRCHEALEELDTIYEKYNRLEGAKKKISWKRLKFGKENIDGIRHKLGMHLRTIQLFLTSVNGDSLGRVERKLEEKTEALHRLEEKVDMILGKFRQEEIQTQKREAATSTALYRFGAPIPPPAGPAQQLGDLVSALKDDGVTVEELNKNFDFISALVLYQGNNSTALVPAARPQAQEPYTHDRYAEEAYTYAYKPIHKVQRPTEKRYPEHSTRYHTPSPEPDLGHSYIANSRPHGRQATVEEASDDEIEHDRFDMREHATDQYTDGHGYSTRYHTPSPEPDLGHSYIANYRPRGRQPTVEEASDGGSDDTSCAMREYEGRQPLDAPGYSWLQAAPQRPTNSYGAASFAGDQYTRAFAGNPPETPTMYQYSYPRAEVSPSFSDNPQLMGAWYDISDTAGSMAISPQRIPTPHGLRQPVSWQNQDTDAMSTTAVKSRSQAWECEFVEGTPGDPTPAFSWLNARDQISTDAMATQADPNLNPKERRARRKGDKEKERRAQQAEKLGQQKMEEGELKDEEEYRAFSSYDEGKAAANARLVTARKATDGGGSVAGGRFGPGGSLSDMNMGSTRASRRGSYGQTNMEHPRFREQQAEFMEQQRAKQIQMAQEQQQQAAYVQHLQAQAEMARLHQL